MTSFAEDMLRSIFLAVFVLLTLPVLVQASPRNERLTDPTAAPVGARFGGLPALGELIPDGTQLADSSELSNLISKDQYGLDAQSLRFFVSKEWIAAAYWGGRWACGESIQMLGIPKERHATRVVAGNSLSGPYLKNLTGSTWESRKELASGDGMPKNSTGFQDQVSFFGNF